MNPFDTPPAGEPLSFEPPTESPGDGPGRGRMVLVAVLTAGLIGGGVAAVSQFASADEPQLGVRAAPEEPTDETVPPVDEGDEPARPATESDGEIIIDVGDGAPVVIDLGDVEGDLEQLSECVGLPALGEFDFGEWEPGELPDFEEFFEDLPFDLEQLEGELAGEFGAFDIDGGSVTVAGPDGVSVIDLGENGSVTIDKSGEEITIETDGDATVSELDEMFGEFEGMLDEMFGDGEFEEFLESLPGLDEMPQFEQFEEIDPEAVQSCLDEVLGN